MRKEIMKFRSWDGLNKKMSFWTMNDLCSWDERSEKPSALDKWMQFTGHTDRNGKEVYEGDVFGYWAKATWVVVWDSKRSSFRFGYHDKEGWSFSLSPTNFKGKQIIGNIYENPELLK